MKRQVSIMVFFALCTTTLMAENTKGQAIFEDKGCVLCHKPDIDTVGPSLKTIATVYTGKESSLVTYLQGQGTPIVDPVRASVMNPQLVKIRTLFEDDMRALTEYIVSISDRPF